MPRPGITLWRSKNKRGAKYLAGWKGADGKRVVWSTGVDDYDEGLRRAVAELGRRLHVPTSLPPEARRETPPVQPDHVAPAQPAPTNGTNGHARQPLDVLARLYGPAPTNGTNGHARQPLDVLARLYGPAPVVTSSAAPAPAAAAPVVPDQVDAPERESKRQKTRKLYEVGGKMLTLVMEGCLKRAVRWAGKEPDEMDDNEEELIREGFEEGLQNIFGKVEIGPAGKIALGTLCAGAGMYMGGKPLPKPKELPAAAEKKPEPPKPAETGEARA